MKNTKLRFAILLLTVLFSVQTTFAQEKEKKEKNSKVVFGLGMSFFNLSNLTYSNTNVPSESIYLIFNIGNKLRIEPSIGLAFSEDSKQYNPGIGVFGKKTISKFNILYGVRFNMGINQYTSTNYSYWNSTTTTTTDKTFGVSPTIGGEYSFIKNFSLGAEVKFSALNSNDEWLSFTNSSVLIRFYF